MTLNPKGWSCPDHPHWAHRHGWTSTAHRLSTWVSKIQTSPKQSLFLTIICNNFCGFPVVIFLLELAVPSEQCKCISPVLTFISLAPSIVWTFLFPPSIDWIYYYSLWENVCFPTQLAYFFWGWSLQAASYSVQHSSTLFRFFPTFFCRQLNEKKTRSFKSQETLQIPHLKAHPRPPWPCYVLPWKSEDDCRNPDNRMHQDTAVLSCWR